MLELDERLQALEEKKQQTIDRVKTTGADKKTSDLAIREIKVHYTSAKNYLKWIYESGFRVNDDLSRNKENYDSVESYRLRFNCF